MAVPHALMLAAARNSMRLVAKDPDACIDTAAQVHADPTASADDRAQAAVLCGRAMFDKKMDSDALVWLDRVPAESPFAPSADAYRTYLHQRRGEIDLANAAADRSRPHLARVMPHAALVRANALVTLGRRQDAITDIAHVFDDVQFGANALRDRARWSIMEGKREEGLADYVVASRRGNEQAAKVLSESNAIPQDPEGQLTHARFLAGTYPQGAIDTIAVLVKRAEASVATRAAAYHLLAAIQHKEGRGDDALAAYMQATTLAPTDREYLADHGWLLCNLGRAQEGYELIVRAAAMPGGTTDEDYLLDGKIAGFLGDTCYALDKQEDALAAFDRAFLHVPRQAARMRRYATILDALGREDEAATMRMAAAIAGDEPAQNECRNKYEELASDQHDQGCAMLGQGEPDFEIIDLFERAIGIWSANSHAWGDFCARHAAMALSNQAYAYNLVGNFEAAVEAGRRAVEARPGFRDGWLNYANQLNASGDPKGALAAFERAEWCDAHYAAPFYGKADAFRQLGRADDTIAALEKAAAIRYGVPSQDRDIHWRLARALHAVGRYEDAHAQWQIVAELENAEESPAVDALAAIGEMMAAGKTELEPVAFRRYGMRPLVWHAAEHLVMRMQFATVPTEAQREELEAVIEGVIDDSPEIPGGVVWSDRFALVILEADPEEELPMEGFETLSAVAEAVHEVAPLVEIVGYNAIGLSEGDMGELWSIAEQPVPDAGPESRFHVAFWPFKFADTRRWDRFPTPEPAAEDEDDDSEDSEDSDEEEEA